MTWQATPTLCDHRSGYSSTGGLPTEPARQWLLINDYGPAECSGDVTHHLVDVWELTRTRVSRGVAPLRAMSGADWTSLRNAAPV